MRSVLRITPARPGGCHDPIVRYLSRLDRHAQQSGRLFVGGLLGVEEIANRGFEFARLFCMEPMARPRNFRKIAVWEKLFDPRAILGFDIVGIGPR